MFLCFDDLRSVCLVVSLIPQGIADRKKLSHGINSFQKVDLFRPRSPSLEGTEVEGSAGESKVEVERGGRGRVVEGSSGTMFGEDYDFTLVMPSLIGKRAETRGCEGGKSERVRESWRSESGLCRPGQRPEGRGKSQRIRRRRGRSKGDVRAVAGDRELGLPLPDDAGVLHETTVSVKVGVGFSGLR